jgi:hypothetical protein
MIKRHAVRDPAPAIMPGYRKVLVAKRNHRLHLIARERALGMRCVIARGYGP